MQGNWAEGLMVTILEGRAKTMNQIIMKIKVYELQQTRALCNIYGNWTLEQLRENPHSRTTKEESPLGLAMNNREI